RHAGGCSDGLVVVYDDAGGTSAARAWWLLTAHGIPCRLLDGGISAWVASGRSLETGVREHERGDVTLRDLSMPTIDVAEAATFSHRGVLLDARAAERYRGDFEPVDPVAGHI